MAEPAGTRTQAHPGEGLRHFDEARRLAQAVRHLHHESLQVNDRLARLHEVSSADFTAFLIIAGTEEPTPKHLSLELGLTTSAITALLDRLESARLVVRAANPADRRSVLIRLTDEGDGAKAQVYRSYLAGLDHAIGRRPELGSAGTSELLHHLAGAIGTIHAEA